MSDRDGIVRIAAVGDLHHTRSTEPSARDVLAAAGREADVLVLCGDLTDHGTVEEAQDLAREIHSAVTIPVVAVLGNHDFSGGKQDEVKRVLCESGIRVLDGEAVEIKGVGFAGVKGFCGGFGKRALGPWGEDIIKHFVREAVDEALKLESALARLRGRPTIAVLHYSPIQETVEGEPVEIFAFLGSSRLEEPLSRYPVQAVFHGHAHRGQPEGKTAQGIPVFNVSIQLLRQSYPERPPFRIFEVPVGEPIREQPRGPRRQQAQ
ncbi:MAG TPA: metallophosphoesterase [Thermoanaerobaculia bacterium]|nr:metallophosphoesterase [Thermoanaerobaculia bacterium]